MPRNYAPANLKTHIAQSVTTLAYLWKLTRADSAEYFFTDHDEEIIYSGDTYKSANSVRASALDVNEELSPDNFDFEMILDSNEIDIDGLKAGLFDYATIHVYLINYKSTGDGVIHVARGKLGAVEIIDDNAGKAEFRSISQMLGQNIGRVYGEECDADLGDTRCGINLASHTVTGTITGVTDNRRMADSGRSEADDFFNYGKLTWTSGNNNGLAIEVKDWVLSTKLFTIVRPMPFDVQVGDTYSVYRGCDKLKSTCKDVFSNLDNFRGFPNIPGVDRQLQYPDAN